MNNCKLMQKLGGVISKIFKWFLNLSRKKKVVVILLLLLVVSLVGGQTFFNKKQDYTLGQVGMNSVIEIITESGTVTTSNRVDIYSPTNGIVKEVFVENGETVTEKQKLFNVKSTATPQEKAAALANVQAAQAALKQAENTRRSTTATVERVYDDLQNHDKDESFSQKETRTAAETAHDTAYAAVVAAQAQLVNAQIAYQATQNATVTAPISGVISNLSVVSGSNVSINNPLAPTSPVLIVSSSGPTEITAAIGEGDINKIKIGQEVLIKLDAVDNKTYQGLIARYDNHGSSTQGVVKFNIYITITDPDDQLKPGMTADVDIVTNKMTNVLSVPNTAVKPYQKGRAVRRLDKNGEIEFIPVKIGVRGKEYTQIIEGIDEGAEIIVSLASEKKEKKKSLF